MDWFCCPSSNPGNTTVVLPGARICISEYPPEDTRGPGPDPGPVGTSSSPTVPAGRKLFCEKWMWHNRAWLLSHRRSPDTHSIGSECQATSASINRDTAKAPMLSSHECGVVRWGDQTNEPKSSTSRNSHKNSELSTGLRSAKSAILRPARALECTRIPLAPYQREGSVSGARKGSRLPVLEGLEPSGSAGSIRSKVMPSQLPESVNQTDKQTNKALMWQRALM